MTMIRRLACVCFVAVAVAGSAPGVAADDLSVVADPAVDFSVFRTFAVHPPAITSTRPELDNPLFAKRLRKALRQGLLGRGLVEDLAAPDIVVDLALTSEDVSLGVPTRARGVGPQPERYAVGMLTIDIRRPGAPGAIWRGVYRDDEQTGSRLMQKLPDDIGKLVNRYPQRKP